jgi:hypothetical protein
MKTNVGVEVYLQTFLNLVLEGGKWSVSRLGHFTPEERTPVSIKVEYENKPENTIIRWLEAS